MFKLTVGRHPIVGDKGDHVVAYCPKCGKNSHCRITKVFQNGDHEYECIECDHVFDDTQCLCSVLHAIRVG